VLAIREFQRLKQEATKVPTNPIQDSRANLLEEGGNDTVQPSSCDWPNWHLQWVVGLI
jgi:hypothetical protein